MKSRLIHAGWMLALAVAVSCQGAPPQPPTIRTITVEPDQAVVLDLTSQVLRLDVPDERPLGSSYVELAKPPEEIIVPRLADLDGDRLVSAAELGQKAKTFDDGLIAAVEMLAQRGAGGFAGRATILQELVAQLLADGSDGEAAEVVAAAAQLGGAELLIPAELDRAVRARVSDFEADPLRSKPMGIYDWNDELQRVFRQDRMLQTPIQDAPSAAQLAAALRASPTTKQGYLDWLHLVRRMTNPFVSADFSPCLLDEAIAVPLPVCFLPPPRSHETELIKRLYGNRPIPDGFDLADELIRQVQDGSIDLRPTESSGWYDYQTWSFEPLARPESTAEAERLELSERYLAELRQLLKGLLALTRESHFKQLEIAMAGMAMPSKPPLEIRPQLAVEPLATHYLRRADSYAFLREVLIDSFGEAALLESRRIGQEGASDRPLLEELEAMEQLFLGAAATVARDLGMPVDALGERLADAEPETARKAFATWAETRGEDPDLCRDIRMMVPVFYDTGREQTKVWAVLGWTRKPLRVTFAEEPALLSSPENRRIEFTYSYYSCAYPVTAELYVDRLLNRDEFRALCDRHRTKTAILEQLR